MTKEKAIVMAKQISIKNNCTMHVIEYDAADDYRTFSYCSDSYLDTAECIIFDSKVIETYINGQLTW